MSAPQLPISVFDRTGACSRPYLIGLPIFWVVAQPSATGIPWVGLIFVAIHVVDAFSVNDDMKTTKDDLEWRKTVKAYVTNDDGNVAPAGHFNSGQKQFYWIMFYGALVLLITGIVMWFPELMPRGAHWVLPLVVFLHCVGALATSAPSSSMFIWVSFSSRADSTVSFTAAYQPRGSKPITVSGMTRQ